MVSSHNHSTTLMLLMRCGLTKCEWMLFAVRWLDVDEDDAQRDRELDVCAGWCFSVASSSLFYRQKSTTVTCGVLPHGID